MIHSFPHLYKSRKTNGNFCFWKKKKFEFARSPRLSSLRKKLTYVICTILFEHVVKSYENYWTLFKGKPCPHVCKFQRKKNKNSTYSELSKITMLQFGPFGGSSLNNAPMHHEAKYSIIFNVLCFLCSIFSLNMIDNYFRLFFKNDNITCLLPCFKTFNFGGWNLNLFLFFEERVKKIMSYTKHAFQNLEIQPVI